MSRLLKGIAGSPGIVVGRLSRILPTKDQSASAFITGEAAVAYFTSLQKLIADQLQQLGDELRAEGKGDEAGIFDAHALIATDPSFTAEVERLLIEEGHPLHHAIGEATEIFAGMLGALEDPYLRERASDVRAIGAQFLDLLNRSSPTEVVPEGAIIVADELTPAQTALLRKTRIAGIATAGGTATGHVAILARALGIPAVVGLGPALLEAPDGAQAVLVAEEGLLIVEPTAEDLAGYQARAEELRRIEEQRKALLAQPVQTADGRQISLWANIGHPDEVDQALAYGAQGVGLFRTEFLFLDRQAPPGEEEQYAAYAHVARMMGERPVIVRTLDVGGDKPIPYLPQLVEPNPFLGIRGIRFSMRFSELFQVQVRALLRAATQGNLRVMLPMVATIEDILWARAQIEAAARDLTREGIACRADMPLGVMVETPAAALTLDLIAHSISFCSIGSNDLAQYVMAADRTSPELTARYTDTSPAVLRAIRIAVNDGQRLGLEMGFCGQLAGEPASSIVLVGLGLDKLSMAPAAIPAVAEALRSVSLAEAQSRALQSLTPASSEPPQAS